MKTPPQQKEAISCAKSNVRRASLRLGARRRVHRPTAAQRRLLGKAKEYEGKPKKRLRSGAQSIWCPLEAAGFAGSHYSMPKIAMPTAAMAMTAYWAFVSFSFRNSRLHTSDITQ